MKKITAKIGEYQKDGQTKGRYVDIGVIMSNENGEYVMIDPTVNLAGVLIKQQALTASKGKQPGDSVLCSIFDNSNQGGQYQQQAPQQAQGFQQQPQQQYNNQAQQGFTGQPAQSQQFAPPQQAPNGFDDFEDDIPFNGAQR